MSLSRLSSLVGFLVLGTALSVWWYLQVPAAAKLRPEPVAVEAALDAQLELEPEPTSTPDSTSVPSSDRWTKRIRPASATAGTARTQAGGNTSEVWVEEAGMTKPCSRSAACPADPAAAALPGPGH